MMHSFTRSMRRRHNGRLLPTWDDINLDPWLMGGLIVTMIGGLAVLYSASSANLAMVEGQAIRFAMALVIMIIIAQIPSAKLARWVPLAYIFVLLLLLAVAALGYHAMGAQRWLVIPGVGRFQPSELMKIVMPLTLANYLAGRPLPLSWKDLFICLVIMAIPTLLILKQPDLGTAMLVLCGGIFVILFAGLSWRLIFICILAAVAVLPVLWMHMHGYQRQRIMTFIDPSNDPQGAGWNIIQSKTAIGSGGIFGKGWMEGSQSQLQFLPESHTDFIVAVVGEEFGLVGMCVLILCYLFIVGRAMILAMRASDTYGRLAGGSLALIFFIYVVINMGMGCGLLPVVGVPLPLVSYGGTASMTLLAGFGILMGIGTQRKLVWR